MATNSSILAWKIPWTEGPGRLQSMGSQRVGHDRATSLSLSLFHFQNFSRREGANYSFEVGMGYFCLSSGRIWGRTGLKDIQLCPEHFWTSHTGKYDAM